MILKRYLRLMMFIDWWDWCACKWEDLPNAGVSGSGDNTSWCFSQTKFFVEFNSDQAEREHLCELRNAMFYIQIQWEFCVNKVLLFSFIDLSLLLLLF